MILLMVGVGVSLVKISFPYSDTTIMVIEAKENYYIGFNGLEKLYIYDKNHSYNTFDIISLHGNKTSIEANAIESSFDFKSYLENKGVYYAYKVDAKENKFLFPLRTKEIKNNFLHHFDDNSASLVKAILFSSLDDNELTSSLESLHLVRFLSTSGFYIALFYKFLLFIFSLFLKKKHAEKISILLIALYNIFLFPKFSVLRFLLFSLLRYINAYHLKHKLDFYSIFGIIGLFFIIIDYHLTYSMSFILGFSFQLFIYLINQTFISCSKKKRFLLRLLFIFIFIIPIDIYFYHELSFTGYLLSIIFSPLFMVYGLLSFITFLGVPLYSFLALLTNGINHLFFFSSYISFPIYAPSFSEWGISLYYLIYLSLLYFMEIGFKPIVKYLSFSSAFLLLLYLLPLQNIILEEINFINVGQGDATFIRKGNTSVLIDTGGLSYLDVAKESLIPFLKKKQIYDIDLVITTHDDYDHVGALSSLMTNFKVKQYIKEASYFPLTINNLTFINYNNYQAYYKEENDKSLVIGFNLLSTSFLIMGDASIAIEKRIMNDYTYIPCDILKVGHHGSNTSSSLDWINYLSPTTAIISCGVNNRYGHPHQDVIKRLKNNNIQIRRTDEEGTITYYGLMRG